MSQPVPEASYIGIPNTSSMMPCPVRQPSPPLPFILLNPHQLQSYSLTLRSFVCLDLHLLVQPVHLTPSVLSSLYKVPKITLQLSSYLCALSIFQVLMIDSFMHTPISIESDSHPLSITLYHITKVDLILSSDNPRTLLLH